MGVSIGKKRKPVSLYVIIISTVLVIYFFLIGLWPFFFNLFLSFWKVNISAANIFEKFIGIRAYKAVFKNIIFQKAIKNNVIYLLTYVTSSTTIALVLAVLVSKTSGFIKKIYIACLFAPVVTSLAAISLVWELMYFPKVGFFSVILNTLFGIPPQAFLQDPKIALYCVILVDIWKSIGLDTVILLAGIDEISDDYYEASIIDGATAIQQFFKITIPLLRPQLFFLLIIKSIYSLKTFVIVFMMTPEPKGGPMYSTQVLGLHLYQQTFLGQKFSYGAVVALIIFVLLLFFVIIQIRFFRSKIE